MDGRLITPTPELLTAVKTARAQCLVRVAQLAGCRVCGGDQRRFEQTVAQLDQLIKDLEGQHATE